jgi:hypothetical protein
MPDARSQENIGGSSGTGQAISDHHYQTQAIWAANCCRPDHPS